MKPEQRAALRRLDQQFDALRAMPEPLPKRERYKYGIEDLGVGAYFRIGGELRQVVSISEYRDKSSKWHELEVFGVETGETNYVEWEKDDEVEISLNGSELSLSDVGVTADQVEEISEEEKGTISYGGRTYQYDDDYAATYHRGGDGAKGGSGEKVYFYDFETKDEKWCLTVEEWGDKSEGYEYSVFVSEFLEPDAVEVLVVAGS